MTTVRETETERMRADKLTVGQHLAPGQIVTGRPTEIVFLDTYPQGIGTEVLIVHRPVGAKHTVPTQVDAARYFTLATNAEVEAVGEAAERAQRIANIRAYADWFEANPDVPMPYGLGGQQDVGDGDQCTAEDVAAVRAFAAKFGARLRELKDRTVAEHQIGGIGFNLIAWHKEGRPAEPEPEREGPWFEAGDEVYPWPVGGRVLKVTEVAAIEGSNPVRQQFRGDEDKIWRHSDIYRPVVRKTDPTGLRYTRDDDGDEPTEGLELTDRAREVLAIAPVSPARAPSHFGVVEDEEPAGPVHMDLTTGDLMCGLPATTAHRWSLVWRDVTCPDCNKAGA